MSAFKNPALHSATPISEMENGDQYIDDDAADSLPQPCRRIYIGTGGDLSVVTPGGNVVDFKNLPDGSFIEGPIAQIRATGTDAADLVVMY